MATIAVQRLLARARGSQNLGIKMIQPLVGTRNSLTMTSNGGGNMKTNHTLLKFLSTFPPQEKDPSLFEQEMGDIPERDDIADVQGLRNPVAAVTTTTRVTRTTTTASRGHRGGTSTIDTGSPTEDLCHFLLLLGLSRVSVKKKREKFDYWEDTESIPVSGSSIVMGKLHSQLDPLSDLDHIQKGTEKGFDDMSLGRNARRAFAPSSDAQSIREVNERAHSVIIGEETEEITVGEGKVLSSLYPADPQRDGPGGRPMTRRG